MKSDKIITDEVIKALLWDARVSPACIKVNTKASVVHLNGSVDNYVKKWSAYATAMKITGVVNVVDNIIVQPNANVSDNTIKENIIRVLKKDVRLNGTKVTVSVNDGTVVLIGVADSYYKRYAAEESCRWVKGVIDVRNTIQVASPKKITDSEIKQKLVEIFAKNSILKDCNISVFVENNVILLMGRVMSINQKIQAEVQASLIANVVFVRNALEINRV